MPRALLGRVLTMYIKTADRPKAFDHVLILSDGIAQIVGAKSLEEMVQSLKKPRRVMMLVMAGKPVDDFIELLLPLLEQGDIIIDGGNSHFPDSEVG